MKRNKIIYLLIFLISLISIGFSIYAQFVLKMNPCPLCIVQRSVLVLICICSLLFSIIPINSFFNKLFSLILILLNLFNIKVAYHHVWLINLPPNQQPKSCGMPIAFMFKKLSTFDFLHKILQGDAECARVKWRVMGFLAPQLIIFLSVFFIILLIYVFLNCANKKTYYDL